MTTEAQALASAFLAGWHEGNVGAWPDDASAREVENLYPTYSAREVAAYQNGVGDAMRGDLYRRRLAERITGADSNDPA